METSVSLLQRLASSPSEDDWQRLVDLYQPLLRAWMTRAGVARVDADDLIQEVLLVVFREVGTFERRGPGAFRSWLRTIMTFRVRDHFRAAGYRPTATGDSAILQRLDEVESPSSALSQWWDREHDEYVAAALLRRVQGDFTLATWLAFKRHVLDEVPARQVAQELGLSLNSVLLAKSRVLKRLREELAGFVD